VKRIIAALLLCLPLTVLAQTGPRYFGYFYNDANNSFQENYAQINLYHISTQIIGSNNTTDRNATTQYTLGQLAQAKALGVRAIITATPFVFYWTDSTQKWSADPNAATVWSTFVNQLIASGYIIPGRPDLSTVAAIYVMDEPDGAGFGDVNGAANPVFAGGVNVIRSNSATSDIPLASILTSNYATSIPQGLKLLDWVGFDWYSATESQWTASYNQLESMLSNSQRTIIVPKAAEGGTLGNGYDDPNFFNNVFTTDPKVVWFSPFVWWTGNGWTGTRDIPALRTAYTQIGGNIRSADCASSPSEQAFCAGAATKTVEIATNLLLQ
jgi:hypothetical protein